MKKLNKIILAGAILAAGLVGQAKAAVNVSTASTSGTTLVTAPSSGKTTKLKGCSLGNNTNAAACVIIEDGSTPKLILCAGAFSTKIFPDGVPSPAFMSGTQGAITALLGEDFAFSGAVNVVGSTTSANVLLTCSSITN